jgi:NDP-sugar pyrophosphorylase family protein
MATSPMYFEQPIVIFDTTEALNATTGSFVLHGGVSIGATYDSNSVSSGAFVLAGGAGIGQSLNVGGATNIAGITHITNTTGSTGSANGALIVSGGVGVGQDLSVAGNATINGNLYVAGQATYVNTQTVQIQDNLLTLNAGPHGSRDAGILFNRDGVDVTADAPVTSGSLTAISDSSFTTGSAFPYSLAGYWLKTADGYAQVQSFNNNTGTFFTSGNTLNAPTNLSFQLYNRSSVAQYFDEALKEYRIGYVADGADPKISLDNHGQYANVRMDTLYANNTISTANLIVTTSSTIANLALSSANLQTATIGGMQVTGQSVLSGAVTAGSLNVNGPSLLQAGVTTGTLNVTGDSLLSGNATVGGSLHVGGSSIFQAITAGTLYVTGGAVLASNVTVGALASSSDITSQTLHILQTSVLSGAVTAGSLFVNGSGMVQQGLTAGGLAVTGNSVLNGTVTAGSVFVTGPSLLAGGLTVSGGSVQDTITAGSLTAIGPVNMKGTLSVTGGSNLFGPVVAYDASTFYGTATMNGDLVQASPSQGATFNGNVTMANLRVTGFAQFAGFTTGSLDVTGPSLLNGAVTAGGLAVSGSSIFGSNVLITGGSLTVTGGSIVFNTVDVSPSMADIVKERCATIGNNITTSTAIQGFSFNNSVARAFDAVVSVTILGSTSNIYAYYNLKGVQKDSGNWVLNSSFVGDVTGITFSINGGQLQYTTTNKVDYTSGIVKFRALTTSIA